MNVSIQPYQVYSKVRPHCTCKSCTTNHVPRQVVLSSDWTCVYSFMRQNIYAIISVSFHGVIIQRFSSEISSVISSATLILIYIMHILSFEMGQNCNSNVQASATSHYSYILLLVFIRMLIQLKYFAQYVVLFKILAMNIHYMLQ